MRILMVSSFLPFPLFSGGHVRLYNIIKELSKKHEITLVCEKRDNQTDSDIDEIKRYCRQLVTFPRIKQWSISNILKTGLSQFPFLMVGHRNQAMGEAIRQELILSHSQVSPSRSPSGHLEGVAQRLLPGDGGGFDLIHVETFYVMQNLPQISLPVVLVEHNVEYLVYKRFANSVSVLIRPLFLIDIAKLKYWEELFWHKADKLVAVSQEDKKMMKREDVEVVPNGVDINKFKIQNSKFKIEQGEKRVLFIGDFKWVQNRDAARQILEKIWPRTQNSKLKTQNSLKLWIVGRSIPESIRNLGGDNVIFDENAQDTVEVFKKATILLAPIRVGGGTSFKILEAMASGVPVVTTSLGASGIGARDNEEIIIADQEAAIAEKLIELINNEELYVDIAKNARKLIEDNFDWKIIVKKLEVVYQSSIR